MRSALPFIVLAIATAPSVATAAPATLELVPSGDDVIVIAHGVSVGMLDVHHRSDRLEIDLDGNPAAITHPFDDATIRKVDVRVRSNRTRRLSIQLRASRDGTRRLAATTRVAQVGDDVQVVISRDPARAPTASFRAEVDVDDLRIHEEQPESDDAETNDTTAVAGPGETPPRDDETGGILGTQAGGAGGPGGIGFVLLLVALAIAGALLWRFRSKRATGPSLTGIDVLSVRQVGPKTRITLVAVGSKQILLSISPAGAQVLGRWERETVGRSRRDTSPGAPAPVLGAARADLTSALRPSPPLVGEDATPRRLRARGSAMRQPAGNRPAHQAAAYAEAEDYASFANTANHRSQARDRRGTSPAIRGILELRDQTLALDNILGDDGSATAEWEEALANGTQAGRLR